MFDDIKMIRWVIRYSELSPFDKKTWENYVFKFECSHSALELLERFTKTIIPNINKYKHYFQKNEYEKVLKISKVGNDSQKISKKRWKFSRNEDLRMIRWASRHPYYSPFGYSIWEKYSVEFNPVHTTQSLWERFRKYIFPKIDDYENSLEEKLFKSFLILHKNKQTKHSNKKCCPIKIEKTRNNVNASFIQSCSDSKNLTKQLQNSNFIQTTANSLNEKVLDLNENVELFVGDFYEFINSGKKIDNFSKINLAKRLISNAENKQTLDIVNFNESESLFTLRLKNYSKMTKFLKSNRIETFLQNLGIICFKFFENYMAKNVMESKYKINEYDAFSSTLFEKILNLYKINF